MNENVREILFMRSFTITHNLVIDKNDSVVALFMKTTVPILTEASHKSGQVVCYQFRLI